MIAERTMFGWRKVARILASERDADLLDAMGVTRPTGATQAWARSLLDSVEDSSEVWGVEPDGGRAVRDLEHELGDMADREAMAGLVDAATVLSRPLSDTEPIDHWRMLLGHIRRDELTLADLPADLGDRGRGQTCYSRVAC